MFQVISDFVGVSGNTPSPPNCVGLFIFLLFLVLAARRLGTPLFPIAGGGGIRAPWPAGLLSLGTFLF